MDDKTFIAAYVAKESERINQKLKDMVNSPNTPSDEQKNEVIQDIETTLARLQSALAQITEEMLGEDDVKNDKLPQ